MDHPLSGLLRVVVCVGLVLLVTGCGEDPRYSARTQYLGGTYGGAEGGPPRDTVSYWDGDSSNGSPSVKISLGGNARHDHQLRLFGLVFVGCRLARTKAVYSEEVHGVRDVSMRPFSPLPSTRGKDQGEWLDACRVALE